MERHYQIKIKIKSASDKHYQKLLETEIDKGEASAIVLAIEMQNAILIIDDLKGRKIAKQMNLVFSGSFGLMLRAKQEGLIKSIKPIIEKIRKSNFRFDEKLLKSILEQARE